MARQPGLYDFVYVDTDIPAGMTIREWRAQRTAERVAQRAAEREARRGSSRTRLLDAGVGRRLRPSGRTSVWRTEMRHSSGAHGRIPT